MKRWIPLLVLTCTLRQQIDSIRPGAEYTLTSGYYEGIDWTDKVQSKPTRQELDTALATCQTSIAQQATKTDQAAQDAINQAKTDTERIEALTKYLGLK